MDHSDDQYGGNLNSDSDGYLGIACGAPSYFLYNCGQRVNSQHNQAMTLLLEAKNSTSDEDVKAEAEKFRAR